VTAINHSPGSLGRATRQAAVGRWFGAALLLALTIGMSVRARYGFDGSDESFYLATANRLLLGQRLGIDEWHPAQFYTPLLVPFLAVYKAAVPSGAGVLLAFRWLHVCFSGATALALYGCCRRRGAALPGLLAGALMLFYCCAPMRAAQYKQLSGAFCVWAFTLAEAAGPAPTGRRRWAALLSGVALACAVLCCPAFAIPAAAGVVLLLARRADRRRGAWIAAGVCACAALYVALALPWGDLGAFFRNLPYVLSDPEHTETLAEKLADWLAYHRIRLSLWQGISIFLASAFALWDGRTGRAASAWRQAVWGVYGALSLLFAGLSLRRLARGDEAFLLAFAAAGIPVALAALLRRRCRWETALYLCGLALSLCWTVCSNTSARPLYGYILCCCALLPLSGRLVTELYAGIGRRAAAAGTLAAGLALAGSMGWVAVAGVYRDAPLEQLTTPLTAGPAKGLYTTKAHAKEYRELLALVKEVRETYPESTAFFTKILPWGYLCGDWACAAPTVWRTEVSSPRLEAYDALHPGSLPDLVFLCADGVGDYEASPPAGIRKAVRGFNKNDLSGWFYDQALASAEIIRQNSYLTVYRVTTSDAIEVK